MGASSAAVALLSAVHDLSGRITSLDVAELDDDQRLELLRGLEDLTRSAAATSARLQVSFARSQVAEQEARGVPRRRQGEGVADDLAKARKTSPYWGSRDLASATALVDEMPRTLAALESGEINGLQARVVTEATTCLDPADRAEADRRLEGMLPGASTKEIGDAARGLVYELDPAGFVRRARKAAEDRGVSCRPAPDVMALLTARLPAPQAVAVYGSLKSYAKTAVASGDPRTLNQLMADEFFYRLTGRRVVDGVDVEVGLLMTDAALFGGAADPTDLEGYGPVPAEIARELLRPSDESVAVVEAAPEEPPPVAGSEVAPEASSPAGAAGPEPSSEQCPAGERCTDWACPHVHGVSTAMTPDPGQGAAMDPAGVVDDDAAASASTSASATSSASTSASPSPGMRAAKAWLRRLYVDEVTGVLTHRDPRRRLFTGSLRKLLIARDRTCRNAWCGAPIRDIDHVLPHSEGGETAEDNGQGMCQHCNLARQRERHSPPAPEDYRPPPPLLTSFQGQAPRGAVAPRLRRAAPTARSDPDDPSEQQGRKAG
ncbi:DUF222 domain-containing protein [Ornithinimicrobium panacihumi]|uniref:HNH endonuclease n=1 Tax=Ornithinimicrobium panacihumi TaxID=2008449 RepID=UPI003F898404